MRVGERERRVLKVVWDLSLKCTVGLSAVSAVLGLIAFAGGPSLSLPTIALLGQIKRFRVSMNIWYHWANSIK